MLIEINLKWFYSIKFGGNNDLENGSHFPMLLSLLHLSNIFLFIWCKISILTKNSRKVNLELNFWIDNNLIKFGMKLVFTFRNLVLIEKALEEKSLNLYIMNLKNQIKIYAYSLESQIIRKNTTSSISETQRLSFQCIFKHSWFCLYNPECLIDILVYRFFSFSQCLTDFFLLKTLAFPY